MVEVLRPRNCNGGDGSRELFREWRNGDIAMPLDWVPNTENWRNVEDNCSIRVGDHAGWTEELCARKLDRARRWYLGCRDLAEISWYSGRSGIRQTQIVEFGCIERGEMVTASAGVAKQRKGDRIGRSISARDTICR
jgi:hypothetical protein